MRLICSTISPPYCSFHAHTRSMNASRPSSRRSMPSSRSLRSTTTCVAMPAWSMPGSHRASKPCMRARRISVSSMPRPRAWPTCRRPVTLGGGITMQYGGFPEVGSAVK